MLQPADVKAAVAEASKGGVTDLFCKNWGIVKKVLNGLANSISNPFVKIAVKIVVQVGNALYAAQCKV